MVDALVSQRQFRGGRSGSFYCSGGSRVAENIAREPAAGKRVKQVHPDWMQTEVYHLLYLPKDWQPGKRYPVIVEYAGNGPYQNRFGDISTGHPEGARWAMALLEAAVLFGCAFHISIPTVPGMSRNGGATNRRMIRSRPCLLQKGRPMDLPAIRRGPRARGALWFFPGRHCL